VITTLPYGHDFYCVGSPLDRCRRQDILAIERRNAEHSDKAEQIRIRSLAAEPSTKRPTRRTATRARSCSKPVLRCLPKLRQPDFQHPTFVHAPPFRNRRCHYSFCIRYHSVITDLYILCTYKLACVSMCPADRRIKGGSAQAANSSGAEQRSSEVCKHSHVSSEFRLSVELRCKAISKSIPSFLSLQPVRGAEWIDCSQCVCSCK
jgi:hypothetical protein